jgi:hypothetical protein
VILYRSLGRRRVRAGLGDGGLHGSHVSGAGRHGQASWLISSVDTDWDDESGQVELRVEASLSTLGSTTVELNKLGYHVTILAEM